MPCEPELRPSAEQNSLAHTRPSFITITDDDEKHSNFDGRLEGMHGDRAITFTSSSIGSSSSFSSSKSSLFALDDSQSDNSMPRGDISQYNVAASPSPLSLTQSQQSSLQSGIVASTASTTQKIKRAFGKRRKQSQDSNSLLAVISSSNSPSSTSNSALNHSWPSESYSTPSSRPSTAKLSMNIFGAKKYTQPSNSILNDNLTHSSTSFSPSSSIKPFELPSHSSRQPATFPQSQLQSRSPSHIVAIHADPFAPLPPPKPRVKHQTKVQNDSSSKSPLAPSSSTTAGIEYTRNTTEIPEQSGTHVSASEETKELWRRSDSTMDSGHTVRPVASSSGTPSESRRVSAYLGDNDDGDECGDVLVIQTQALPSSPPTTTTPAVQRLERPSTSTDSKPSASPMSRQIKRRSLSLTIPATSSTSQRFYSQLQHQHHSPHISPTHVSTNSVPFASFTSAANATDIPIITQTSSASVSPASIVIQPSKNNNLRGRLAAWTNHSHRTPSPSPASSPIAQASTSSPSLLSTTSLSTPSSFTPVRTPLGSDVSQTDLHAVNIVRQMQSRVRSPSNSSLSNSAGHIRQAATSLTSNASAMALGLGKRAYEKVNKVWGGGGPPSHGSGSGSDTSSYHHPSPVSASPMQLCPSGQERNPSHGPSAFNARRSPNSSGSWSIPSQSPSSRSSSERDGRDTPSSFSSLGLRPIGKLVRPPCAPSGLVFRRELWECVKDTRTTVSSENDPLATRMIPALIYRCVQHLYKWGLEEEGLFRIPGRAGHAARLRNDFDGGTYRADYDIIDCPPSDLDPHAVASIFKAYLRELPESILTRAWGPLFDNAIIVENSLQGAPLALGGKVASNVFSSNTSLGGPLPGLRKPPSLSTFALPNIATLRTPSTTLTNTLRDLISRLPQENYDLLLTVVELIRATAAKSVVTKMPLSNLLLVFCPSLNMSPTLLRVLCDAPSVWENVIQNGTSSMESTHNVILSGGLKGDDDEEVKDKDEDGEIYSDAVSEEGEGSQESPEMKGDEWSKGDLTNTFALDLTTSATTADDISNQVNIGVELSADEDVILIPSSRTRQNKLIQRQEVRRVPIPPSTSDEVGYKQIAECKNNADYSVEAESRIKSATVEVEADDQTLPHSDSTTSFHSSESMQNINLNSQSASQVSLLSSEGDADADVETGMSSGIRVNTNAARFYKSSPHHSPKSSSPLTASSYNYDKALPASPRTPSSTFQGVTRANTPPLEHVMTHIRRTSTKNGKSHKQRRVDRIGSFSSPSLLGPSGASIPNVVFPSIGNSSSPNSVQGPVTPTSLKKLTISLAQRNSKVLDNINVEEEGVPAPSPSKRMGRRPSLNLLFNMKHGSTSTSTPSSPRSRTPTISGPILFQNVGSGGGWEEVVPTSPVANTKGISDAPPVLSLEINNNESSLGWEDVFRISSVTKDTGEVSPSASLSLLPPPPISLDSPPHPRPVAVSQPTLPIHQTQTLPTQPQTINSVSVSSRRPLTEYLLSSSGFFSVNGPPASLPTPATVLAAAELPNEVYTSSHDETASSYGDDSSSSSLQDVAVESGLGSFSFLSTQPLPPHFSFQLQGSSFEEDWANTVLLMASDSDK
ncbi:hypothetical protein Clacol_000616 [Clathrus columnatus]|uniref:Rho-GAP domain-containing protein n=1 Tax=Clathrus columnatus TaxID=1419009 RepID=A0AAV5A090_9AGAM|nr:hypothetical protein Clacol_000616 [Clathrus columnatus]